MNPNSIYMRHAEIGDDHIRHFDAELGKSVFGRLRGGYPRGDRGEDVADESQRVRFVVDSENVNATKRRSLYQGWRRRPVLAAALRAARSAPSMAGAC